MNDGTPRRVWVDLANSPHAVLFEPIVAELRRMGHDVVLTARDHAQTVELARQRWPDVRVIGGASPPGRLRKAGAIAARARALARFARDREIDVAVSHGSYAAAAAARVTRIPCVTAMDYEYQPANHVAFRFANRVVVPEDLPSRTLRAQGAPPGKLWRYRGFKEEVYLERFRPDPGVLATLGLSADEPFFVARPSPRGATYHQFENPLFDRVLTRTLEREDAKVVLLPRRSADLEPYANLPPDRQVLPDGPLDTRSLLYYATALFGAGGTMNREAALLGTPVFGLFAGRLGALDRRLVEEGRLHPVDDTTGLEERLEEVVKRRGPRAAPALTRHVLDRFLEAIVTLEGRNGAG